MAELVLRAVWVYKTSLGKCHSNITDEQKRTVVGRKHFIQLVIHKQNKTKSKWGEKKKKSRFKNSRLRDGLVVIMLACRQEDLSSSPQHPHKKLGVAVKS